MHVVDITVSERSENLGSGLGAGEGGREMERTLLGHSQVSSEDVAGAEPSI